MAAHSAIEWTDATVNFWEGCTRVGPGCDFCYAAERDRRFYHGEHWGPGAPRRWVKGAMALIARLQREADDFERACGRRRRVFINSLADFLDNEVDSAWRLTACTAMDAADRLDLQLVTKRIGNLIALTPSHWLEDWPRHVGLMITVCNQTEADRDIPKLLAAKARFNIPWVGLSCEPLLGPVDLAPFLSRAPVSATSGNGKADRPPTAHPSPCGGIARGASLNWVIAGGESGPGARPSHPDWFRSLRDECAAAGVPFFFKQWGEWSPSADHDPKTCRYAPKEPAVLHVSGSREHDSAEAFGLIAEKQPGWAAMCRVGKTAAGAALDGNLHREFPGTDFKRRAHDD